MLPRHAVGGVARPTFLLMRERRSKRKPAVDRCRTAVALLDTCNVVDFCPQFFRAEPGSAQQKNEYAYAPRVQGLNGHKPSVHHPGLVCPTATAVDVSCWRNSAVYVVHWYCSSDGTCYKKLSLCWAKHVRCRFFVLKLFEFRGGNHVHVRAYVNVRSCWFRTIQNINILCSPSMMHRRYDYSTRQQLRIWPLRKSDWGLREFRNLHVSICMYVLNSRRK